MAAGWSVLGACYTTPQQVINAFTGLQANVHTSDLYLHYLYNVSLNMSTGVISYNMRNDAGGTTARKTYQFLSCDTDYTPTPANAVIQAGNGNGTGVVLPPLTSVTPDTKFSSMGLEDVVLICCVLFACLFGFSSGVTTGKGIAK